MKKRMLNIKEMMSRVILPEGWIGFEEPGDKGYYEP